MGSKRRSSIKRQGMNMFAPDCDPCYTYNGKVLIDPYDRRCFEEGWYKEQGQYESAKRREEEELNHE